MSERPLLVLAGGFGTRLRSAIPDVPKPLAPVEQKPFLHFLIEKWASQGVRRMTFLLHHQADRIKSFLDFVPNNENLSECELSTLTEPQPLGTGGAIAFAVRQLGLTGSFLVANADTWLGSGLQLLSASPAPAIAIVNVQNSERYGSVVVESGRVVAFREKQSSTGPAWINAGLYHLHANLFRNWDGSLFSLERELFPRLVRDGQLGAVPVQDEFIDIGIPEDYFRFCSWIASGRREPL